MKNTKLPLLPAMIARYRSGLEAELRAAMPHMNGGVEADGQPIEFYRMLHYHMGWADEVGNLLSVPTSRGKAIRPTLCLLSCEALSGEWTKALPAAAALEFIHNFSLIHDDIQDGDLERRHQPTVWALWGQPQALVAGNAMRALADIAVSGLTSRGLSDEKALRASYLLTKGYLDMTRGQCLDLHFEGSLDIRLESYLNMIACKTGVLIRYGMEVGASIGSEEETFVRAFARCGNYLGLAFQIRDDVLGTWGDEATTGKAVGNDILRKKKSFPIVYALEVAGDAAKRQLVDVYSKGALEDQDVQVVLTILDDLKALDYAQGVTREKAGLAVQEVRRVPLPSWAHQEIEELVEFLTARQY